MADRNEALRAIFDEALRGKKTSKRHPAEVTSDRLGDAVMKWGDQFTGEELDMVGQIRDRLERIAEQANPNSATNTSREGESHGG